MFHNSGKFHDYVLLPSMYGAFVWNLQDLTLIIIIIIINVRSCRFRIIIIIIHIIYIPYRCSICAPFVILQTSTRYSSSFQTVCSMSAVMVTKAVLISIFSAHVEHL